MPMIDAFVPEGALAPAAEARLWEDLTTLLIRAEGFAPDNERARAATWIFLHRPRVFRAGLPASHQYRFILSVPEGQYDEAARAAVVREVTEAVARAEGRPFEDTAARTWVFPNEVEEGHWGGRGAIRPLADIIASLAGEHERPLAHAKLARRRREKVAGVLAALLDAARGAR